MAKGMEGIDMHLVRIGTYKVDQAPAHGHYARVGISKAKYVFGKGISLQQDLANTAGQDLRLSRTGTGNDHHWPFDSVYGQLLLLIQLFILFPELVLQGFPCDGHSSKLRGYVFRVRGFGLLPGTPNPKPEIKFH